MVHVGIYCVRDAVFDELPQVPGAAPAGVGAGAAARADQVGTPRAWDPSAPGPLEEAKARARAAYDTATELLLPDKIGGGGGGDDGGAEWRPPGELHHARIGATGTPGCDTCSRSARRRRGASARV